VKSGINWTVQGNVTPIELDITGPRWELDPQVRIFGGFGSLGSILISTDRVTVFGSGNSTPALSERTTTLTDLGGHVISQTSGLDIYDGHTGVVTNLTIPSPRFPFIKIFEDETRVQTSIKGERAPTPRPSGASPSLRH
jgi:hypothetical protein